MPEREAFSSRESLSAGLRLFKRSSPAEVLEVAVNGGWTVLDKRFEGNLGIGRIEQADSSSGVTTVTREIRPNDRKILFQATQMLVIPDGMHVGVSMEEMDGSRHDMLHQEEVSFIYLPDRLVTYGKIGPVQFLSRRGFDVLFGGRLRYGGVRGGTVIMDGGGRVELNSRTTSEEIGGAGIVLAKLAA